MQAILACFTHADLSYRTPPEERRGRDILPRSLVESSGSNTESSYVAAAKKLSNSAIERRNTERYARASINQSSRGSPIPSETDAPRLRSAGKRATSWASKCTASKAGPGISSTSLSTAARTFPQPTRSATTNGDALRGRKLQINNLSEGRPVKGALHLRTYATWCLSNIKVIPREGNLL